MFKTKTAWPSFDIGQLLPSIFVSESLPGEQAVDVVAQLLLGTEGEIHVTILKLQVQQQHLKLYSTRQFRG